jgi:hypothetical protein
MYKKIWSVGDVQPLMQRRIWRFYSSVAAPVGGIIIDYELQGVPYIDGY